MNLDNIDTKRLMEYVVKCNTELNDTFAFEAATPNVLTQLRIRINEMLKEIKEFDGVKIIQSEVVNNEIKVTFDMPIQYCEGYSAKQLRDMGVTIGEHIPDCAVIKNGMFEWVNLDFTIGGENEKSI